MCVSWSTLDISWWTIRVVKMLLTSANRTEGFLGFFWIFNSRLSFLRGTPYFLMSVASPAPLTDILRSQIQRRIYSSSELSVWRAQNIKVHNSLVFIQAVYLYYQEFSFIPLYKCPGVLTVTNLFFLSWKKKKKSHECIRPADSTEIPLKKSHWYLSRSTARDVRYKSVFVWRGFAPANAIEPPRALELSLLCQSLYFVPSTLCWITIQPSRPKLPSLY